MTRMSAVRSSLVTPLRALSRRRSVILGYHGVAASEPGHDPHNLRVAPQMFRTQVELLLEAGFELVTVAGLAQRLHAGQPPPGLAALSFDDGMEDNHSVLLPILREYEIPATVYVTTGIIGQPNPWLGSDAGARMMTEHELREMSKAGVELGAHTVTHPNMQELDYDSCLREMVESRDALADLTGERVRTFAYPFCKYGEAAVRAARDSGFDAAVTCQWRGSWAPFEMKRVMITGKDGPASVALKLREIYGPIFHSTPGRLARAATRKPRRAARAAIESRRRQG